MKKIINDSEHSLQEDYSVPEREVDLELVADEEDHQRQRAFLARRLLSTGTRSRPGTKRDRKKGKYKPEGTGMDA